MIIFCEQKYTDRKLAMVQLKVDCSNMVKLKAAYSEMEAAHSKLALSYNFLTTSMQLAEKIKIIFENASTRMTPRTYGEKTNFISMDMKRFPEGKILPIYDAFTEEMYQDALVNVYNIN